MKVFTNTTLIENRAKWGKRIAPVTMLLLLTGFTTNILDWYRGETGLIQITLILLALGFFSAIMSSYLVNTWVREPRADQVLSQSLKKFNNDYVLFNYTAPVSHVLIAPDGLYVFVVKNQNGEITVDGRRFSRKFEWQRLFRLLADEGLGAPVPEAENRVKKLYKFLSNHLADEDIPEIKPLILFSNKELQLSVTNPVMPVITTKDFKSYMREQGKERTISAVQRKKLVGVLNT